MKCAESGRFGILNYLPNYLNSDWNWYWHQYCSDWYWYCIVLFRLALILFRLELALALFRLELVLALYCIVQIGIGIVLFRLALVLFRLELGDTTADFSTSTMTMLWLAVSFYNSQKVTVIISNLLHAWKYKLYNVKLFDFSVWGDPSNPELSGSTASSD